MFLIPSSFSVSLTNIDAVEALAYMRSIMSIMFVLSPSIQGSATPLRRPALMHTEREVALVSVGKCSRVATVSRLYRI